MPISHALEIRQRRRKWQGGSHLDPPRRSQRRRILASMPFRRATIPAELRGVPAEAYAPAGDVARLAPQQCCPAGRARHPLADVVPRGLEFPRPRAVGVGARYEAQLAEHLRDHDHEHCRWRLQRDDLDSGRAWRTVDRVFHVGGGAASADGGSPRALDRLAGGDREADFVGRGDEIGDAAHVCLLCSGAATCRPWSRAPICERTRGDGLRPAVVAVAVRAAALAGAARVLTVPAARASRAAASAARAIGTSALVAAVAAGVARLSRAAAGTHTGGRGRSRGRAADRRRRGGSHPTRRVAGRRALGPLDLLTGADRLAAGGAGGGVFGGDRHGGSLLRRPHGRLCGVPQILGRCGRRHDPGTLHVTRQPWRLVRQAAYQRCVCSYARLQLLLTVRSTSVSLVLRNRCGPRSQYFAGQLVSRCPGVSAMAIVTTTWADLLIYTDVRIRQALVRFVPPDIRTRHF